MLLLLAHRRRLTAFIAKQLVNSVDVEDVFQKTSLILWKKMDQFDPSYSFMTWACGIAFNEIRNHIRVKGRQRLYFNAELLDLMAAEAEQETELSQARMDALKACIAQLPVSQQQLIQQCYFDSDSTAHVADSKGISRGALYKQLARLRQKLLICIRGRIDSESEHS